MHTHVEEEEFYRLLLQLLSCGTILAVERQSRVWQNGVRTAHQLANADKEDLVAAGVTSAIHAKDIKARARPQGYLLATASCIYGLTFHYRFCTCPILRDLQLFNGQHRYLLGI